METRLLHVFFTEVQMPNQVFVETMVNGLNVCGLLSKPLGSWQPDGSYSNADCVSLCAGKRAD